MKRYFAALAAPILFGLCWAAPAQAACSNDGARLNPVVANTYELCANGSGLPSGAATSAKQDTGNTSLSSIDTKVGTTNTTLSTIDGHVDGLEGSASSIATNTATTATNTGADQANAGSDASKAVAVQGITGGKAVSTTSTNLPATVDTNSGNKSASTIRVVIATDQPALSNALSVSQSGTWTVQPGNTENTTPWLVEQKPTASTYSGNVSSTAVAAIATAATIHDYEVGNPNATPCYLQIWNTAQGSVTVGTTAPLKSIMIPANGGANVSGLRWTFTTAVTLAGTTLRAGSSACALDVNLGYN